MPISFDDMEVHTIAVELGYIYRQNIFSNITELHTYIGLKIFYPIADNAYVRFPGYFPEDYYKANALHGGIFWGVRLSYAYDRSSEKQKRIGLYTELSTTDS